MIGSSNVGLLCGQDSRAESFTLHPSPVLLSPNDELVRLFSSSSLFEDKGSLPGPAYVFPMGLFLFPRAVLLGFPSFSGRYECLVPLLSCFSRVPQIRPPSVFFLLFLDAVLSITPFSLISSFLQKN